MERFVPALFEAMLPENSVECVAAIESPQSVLIKQKVKKIKLVN
jgi:hypothetical protein